MTPAGTMANMSAVGGGSLRAINEEDRARVNYVNQAPNRSTLRLEQVDGVSSTSNVDKLIEHYADLDHEKQHNIYLIALQIVSGLLS